MRDEDNLGPQRCHSLPRAIFLSKDRLEIRSRPVNEVRTLRDPQSHRHFNNIILSRETSFELIRKINGSSMELCVPGVKPRQNNQQVLWIYINRTLSQRNPASAHGLYHAPLWLESTTISNQWSIELDIFIDHSVIEVFEPQGGRFAITVCVYPEDANANNFAVYIRNTYNQFQCIICLFLLRTSTSYESVNND